MSDGEFLNEMGTDAEKWAKGWQKNTDWFVPERVLIPWFANAIEAGRSAGYYAGLDAAREAVTVYYPDTITSETGQGYEYALRQVLSTIDDLRGKA